MEKIIYAFRFLIGCAFFSVFLSNPAHASFSAGRIIDDAVFNNKNSMSVQDIQSFLNGKVPTCDTNHAPVAQYAQGAQPPWVCLKNFSEGGKSAAQIIWETSQTYSINPQVILVTLQKENGLITDSWPYPWQYRTAMGFACPDTAACDPAYYGFTKQVQQGARHFRNFADQMPGWTIPYRPGVRTIQWSPNANCGSSSVNIVNGATAALYSYTPYQPNAAALSNLYGSGDSCSSYGNRNFWRDFTNWFGNTLASPLIKVSGGSAIYMEYGNNYYGFPSLDVVKAYGFAGMEVRTVDSNYLSGKTQGPNLSTIVKYANNPAVYLVDQGVKKPFSSEELLNSYGYTVAGATQYDAALINQLTTGSAMQNVAKSASMGIFSIEGSKKRLITDWETYTTEGSPTYSSRPAIELSDEFTSQIVDGAPILKNGRIVKASGNPAIFLFDNGHLLTFTPETLRLWNGRVDIDSLSNVALSQIQTSGTVSGKVKDSSGQIYFVDNGFKKALSPSMATKWGVDASTFQSLVQGTLDRLTTKNLTSTVTKPGGGVFEILNGKHYIYASGEDFLAGGRSWGQIESVDDSTFNNTSNGGPIYKNGRLVGLSGGGVVIVNKPFEALGITDPQTFSALGLRWSDVFNQETNAFNASHTVIGAIQPLLRNGSAYYLADGGHKMYISAELYGSSVYDYASRASSDLSDEAIATISTGKPLTKYVSSPGQCVYFIQNGQRRCFANPQALFNAGGSWDSITTLSPAYLNSLGLGTPIN